MATLDILIVLTYMAAALGVGLAVTKKASQSSEEYFLAGRSLPWWLAGTSMVATTFAADTPLAVTGLVAMGGIAGNWMWWCTGIAHVIAALVFARYWRRLRVVTDAEVLELRYTGRTAATLRIIKAAYQAIFLNCLTMGWVILAMQKVSSNLFPTLDPIGVTFGLMALAVTYSLLGGMRSVVITDMAQFCLAVIGALILVWVVLADSTIGGLGGLVTRLHEVEPERAASLLAFVPRGDLPDMPVTLFAVFLTVAWWRQAEGGGYIVQRLGATRSVRDAERASIWFAVLHNAIRPWPWILVALAALVIWPLGSVPAAGACGELLETCGPGFACVENLCQFDREATYAMLLVEKLPVGALGLVVASLLAAFMSTIDTHVNWGASYLVRDIWERFIHPDASPREQVRVGRIGVLAMAGIAAAASTQMTSIVSVWMFLITLGGGMGAVSILRWLWWRVNAEAELASLVAATALTIVVMTMGLPKATGILLVAFGSLAVWVPVALFGPKTDEATLDKFYQQARPTGAWGPVAQRNPQVDTSLEKGISLRILAGFVAVYATLFGIGGLLLHSAMAASLVALLGGLVSFYWLLGGAPEDGKAGLP